MSILNQKTLNNVVEYKGIGLHTGKSSTIKIFPAEPNTGIVFKRIDLKKNNLVIPSVFNVSDARYCTTIKNEFGTKVSTVEHLMAAFYICGIDNLIVKEAYCVKQVVMKRFRARAKGRAAGIKKPYSNLTVILSEKIKEIKDGTKS